MSDAISVIQTFDDGSHSEVEVEVGDFGDDDPCIFITQAKLLHDQVPDVISIDGPEALLGVIDALQQKGKEVGWIDG